MTLGAGAAVLHAVAERVNELRLKLVLIDTLGVFTRTQADIEAAAPEQMASVVSNFVNSRMLRSRERPLAQFDCTQKD